MKGKIFQITLRQNWRKALIWGVGLGLVVMLTLAFVPSMDVLRQYEQLFATLPAGVLQAFGIEPGKALTPDSFTVSFLFSRLTLFLGVYAVLTGMSITANEEDEGIMNSLMALPVARRQVMGERLLAHFLLTLGLVLMIFAGFLIGSRLVTMQFNLPLQFVTILSLFLPVSVMIAATAFLGVLVRSRGLALGLAALLVIASFFLDTLGAAVSEGILPTLRWLSFFSYNTASNIVAQGGMLWGQAALLLLLIGVLTGGALLLWQRRDIGL